MNRSWVVWIILSLALMPAWWVAVAHADDAKPTEVLKNHGLSVKRGGSTYFLAAEADVQSKFNEAQRLFKQLSYALMRQHEFEQEADRQKRVVPGLLEERILRNQQLRAINQQDIIGHNELVARINEINDMLRLIDSRTADPHWKQEIDKEASDRRAAYIQVVLNLRNLVDSTTRQYTELAADDTIKTALTTLGSNSKSAPKLGPSRGFDENVKQLVKWERSVLSKAIEMRRKGGVFEVDVTLNGKETTPMIFDTGASLVILSSECAAKIGLNPQATDPTVQLHDATGGVTPAKMMTISTVRVGPFTVNNVDCAIMPATKRDVPLLLGQSFLGQFTHKVDNGRLVLSKVETPGSQPKPAGTSKRTTKAKRSTKAATTTNAPAATADPERSF